MKKTFLTLFLCVLFFPSEGRQSSSVFRQLKVKDGLSDNKVRCMLQDRQGFMWFGSRGGLCRFDGYEIKEFRSDIENPFALINNDISALYEDKSGFIWIGTRGGGLHRFDPVSEKFVRWQADDNRSGSLSHDYINDITQDLSGHFWVGTDAGLNRFKLSEEEAKKDRPEIEFEVYFGKDAKKKGQSEHQIYSMLADSDGNLWLGLTDYGIRVFKLDENGQILSEKDYEAGAAGNPFSIKYPQYFFEDKSGKIWIGGWLSGLHEFDPKTEKVRHFAFDKKEKKAGGLPSAHVYEITEDKDGNIWFCAYSGGLCKLNPKTGEVFTYKHEADDPLSLSHPNCRSLLIDRSGVIWVGTLGGGVNYKTVPRENFFFNRIDVRKTSTEGWKLAEDTNGFVWYGVLGGVFVTEKNPTGKGFREVAFFKYEDEGLAGSFKADEKGNIWASADKLYRLRYNPGKKEIESLVIKKENSPGLLYNGIRDVFFHKKKIYAGLGANGLHVYDTVSRVFKNPESENAEPIQKGLPRTSLLFQSKNGHLWHAAKGDHPKTTIRFYYSLTQYDADKQLIVNKFEQNPNISNSLPNAQINGMAEDDSGRIWLSSSAGLSVLEKNSFRHFRQKDGLLTNKIYSLIKDKEGILWAGSAKGLIRMNPKTYIITPFDRKDGINFLNLKGSALLKTGELLFASDSGFYSFRPADLKENKVPPRVNLTGLKVFNKRVKIGESKEGRTLLTRSLHFTSVLNLTYDEKIITFEFSATDYHSSEKNNFAYMLEGVDPEWNYTGFKKRSATYTALKGGTYLFKVKASNNDGVWSEVKQITVIVSPPFYETKLFFALLAFLFAAGIFAVFKVRTSVLKQQKVHLEQEVSDRTKKIREQKLEADRRNADLQTQKEEILIQNEEIQQQSEELVSQKEYLEVQKAELVDAHSGIKTLNEIGRKITSVLDRKELISRLYEDVKQLMPADSFSLGLYNKHTQHIDFEGSIENNQLLNDHSDDLNATDRLSVYCYKKQSKIVINDYNAEASKYIETSQEVAAGGFTESMIYLPITTKKSQLGVITVQSFEKSVYNDRHLTFLETLTSYIAVALENIISYETLKIKNIQMTDSIRYAKTIQSTILPSAEKLESLFPEHFVLYRPKDIVSGDFYWAAQENKDTLIIEADCTGHGVPGAFMSVVGSSLLDDITSHEKGLLPSEILERTDAGLQQRLNQEKGKNTDGMDLTVCRISPLGKNKAKLLFSAAKQNAILIKNNELFVLKGDRRSVGGSASRNKRPFTNQEFEVQTGDTLYLFSDGFRDQNNKARKSYGGPRLYELLRTISGKNLTEQRDLLLRELDEHSAGVQRRDDITIIGIRF